MSDSLDMHCLLCSFIRSVVYFFKLVIHFMILYVHFFSFGHTLT